MNKIIVCLFGLILAGAGCSGDNPVSFLFLTKRSPAAIESNFCEKEQQKAQAKINSFQLKNEFKPFFAIWQQIFLKTNSVDASYFDSHIFPLEVRERNAGDYKEYDFSYYLKLGDIYLEVRSGDDFVMIKSAELDNFKKESIVSLLEKISTEKDISFNEPHPTFGKLPAQMLYKFTWGQARAASLHSADNVLPEILSCNEAVALLKTCRKDISPSDINYKPALNYMWLGGFTGNAKQLGEAKKCATATVDLQKKKLDFCATDTGCSRNSAL